MTQFPPPPYGFPGYPPPPPPPPPPPGYGYPPPYVQFAPQPQVPAKPPASPPKSRRARLLDALTVVFELVVFMLVLMYVLARMSGNEDRSWANRVAAAQALERGARQSAGNQLAAAAATLQESAGVQAHTNLTLDSAAWLTTLESILDEQAALMTARDETRLQQRAAALQALKPKTNALGGGDYPLIIQTLATALLTDPVPPAGAAVTALLNDSALPLARLSALQQARGMALSRLPALSPADAGFGKRRAALRSLIVLLAARARVATPVAATTTGARSQAAADRQLLVVLTVVYLQVYFPADLELSGRGGGSRVEDAAQALGLCVRAINQASVAMSHNANGNGDAVGRLAAGLEQALPDVADLADRAIARLIENHLARWRLGRKTELWDGAADPQAGDWSGADPFGVTAAALFNLSANLHAIAGRPVTATVTIRNGDGSQSAQIVSDWLARLAEQAALPAGAAAGADGSLQVGRCNFAACVAGLDRELRIARAQLHLLQINAQLHDNYGVRQSVLERLDPQPIDPITGRPYVYKPYANDWDLFSDFGEADPAATPNQLDDPKKDMKATLRDGLVLR